MMLRTLSLVVAGLVAGLAIAFLMEPSAPPSTGAPAGASTAPAGTTSLAGPSGAARLADLEAALEGEIEQREALEMRVIELAAEIEAMSTNASGPREGGGAVADAGPAVERAQERFRRDATALREDVQRRQVERLIAAGFAPDRAEWINRRASELRMEQLQAQYEAAREGRPFEPGMQLGGERTLRDELGDPEYERYLQALGRPTSVAVQGVLASSPAERSGLKAGDEVIVYDGKRVFDMRELNALTLEGNPGESVVVEVRRDGQGTQLVMPRGPIGILGGFRGR